MICKNCQYNLAIGRRGNLCVGCKRAHARDLFFIAFYDECSNMGQKFNAFAELMSLMGINNEF